MYCVDLISVPVQSRRQSTLPHYSSSHNEVKHVSAAPQAAESLISLSQISELIGFTGPQRHTDFSSDFAATAICAGNDMLLAATMYTYINQHGIVRNIKTSTMSLCRSCNPSVAHSVGHLFALNCLHRTVSGMPCSPRLVVVMPSQFGSINKQLSDVISSRAASS